MGLESFGFGLVIVALIVVVAVAVRAATVNRLVKRKLTLSILLAGVSLIVSVAVRYGTLPAAAIEHGHSLAVLLRALAAINALVAITLNPLRRDRVSESFPNIVQDAIVVALFAAVSILVLGEKVFATSAVGAVVVGFALQDTLGNAFAGLAIQIEKPFRPGQWIKVGDHEGVVTEITWRATKLRTKADTFVILPNNVMSREAIVNFSEPVLPVRIAVEVGATYDKPPNEVKAAMHEAIANAPLALREPRPVVLLTDFGASSITYQARFWVQDYGTDTLAMDQVRTAIYYSFKRQGIEIPYPIQVEYSRQEVSGRSADATSRFAAAVSKVPVFADLSDEDRRELVDAAIERPYGAGDVVVKQGEPGASMFVVGKGNLRVTIAPNDAEVAQLGPGSFFGEMSLLTGNPRTATVSAVSDCDLLEITADGFKRFVMDQPAVLEKVAAAVMKRQQELEATRASATTATTTQTAGSFLAAVKKFLGM
jgi:small-conductance mechanosensitive channel/CRP-like cAMP-binding protein